MFFVKSEAAIDASCRAKGIVLVASNAAAGFNGGVAEANNRATLEEVTVEPNKDELHWSAWNL